MVWEPFKSMSFSTLSISLNRKHSLAFSSIIFAGMVFVVGTLLCFFPLAFNAQGSVSNTTNAQVSEQEEENNNKAIIVASTGAIFDSGIIGPGQASKEITINADTGRYDYYCTLHPFMKGQLTIEE
jgi:hypothetical protein